MSREKKTNSILGFSRGTGISTLFSFAATFFFAVYNAYLGIRYVLPWNTSIFVYYLVLTVIRGIVIFHRKKTGNSVTSEGCYLLTSSVLLLINIALLVPVSLLVVSHSQFTYGLIPAIAKAAYTTYKTVMAVRNFVKYRKDDDLMMRQLKTVSFIDALVSILVLQNALITAVGTGDASRMLSLAAASSFAIMVLILFISIRSFIAAIKKKKATR